MFLHLSVCPQHALQVVSQHALQVSRGGGFQAHTQGGKLRGLAGGGSPGPHLGGGSVYPSMHWGRPPPVDGYCHGQYASYWNAFLFEGTFQRLFCYCPQTKFAKVMFLQVSVCPQGEACVAHGGGHVWQRGMHGRGACMAGVCMAGGMCGWGVCMAGGACVVGACMAGGCVWLGDMAWQRGWHSWQGGMHGGGACVAGGIPSTGGGGGMCCHRQYRILRDTVNLSGRYASYWNAFLLTYCYIFLKRSRIS